MSVTDEIKQRTDIVEVIGQHTALAKAGRTFRGLCPFHSEKTPSFFVYPEQQSWHCFGACNTGGDVFSFVMKKEGIDFGEALKLLGERTGVAVHSKYEPGVGKKEKEQLERLYQANLAAAQYYHNLLLNSPAAEKVRSYLAGRGLSSKSITDFQLGFSPDGWEFLKKYLAERGYQESELLTAGLIIEADDKRTHDRFRNRLMFPILDAKGRVTGFGGRVLDDSLPKYLNSPQTPAFDKSSSLYGIHLAQPAIRKQEMAIIVEGYMDVIIAHQYGFSNVVAPMGTAITDRQVGTIKKLSRNMVLALDSDAAGEEAMLRGIVYENTLDAEVKVIILPGGKDPDEVIKEDKSNWQKLVESAMPVVDYTFNMVTSKLDLSTARDKAAAVDKLLPVVAGITNIVRRDHYLRRLAELVNTSYAHLETVLSRSKPDRKARETKQEATSRALRPVLSNPLEEYCLALLLKHPQLKARCRELPPEYFQSSENREIFISWQNAEDPALIKNALDVNIHEHLDSLLGRELPYGNIEQKYSDTVLRLRERHLRGLEAKRAAVFSLEAESGGASAALMKLQEQGMEVSVQLGEVFTQKSRKRFRLPKP
ncbi:MAG: DNA primase [Chloroflexi bacterium]|nr:DNA primase [Chloroflexota bacterium]